MEGKLKRQPRLLIVEDEKLVRWYLSRALAKHGYHVDSVSSGEDAVEELKLRKYDVVITDIRLEGMDGLEVAAVAKNLTPSAKVIVITAYGTPEAEDRARQCGVLEFMNKPIEEQSIVNVVESAVGTGARGGGDEPFRKARYL